MLNSTDTQNNNKQEPKHPYTVNIWKKPKIPHPDLCKEKNQTKPNSKTKCSLNSKHRESSTKVWLNPYSDILRTGPSPKSIE